MHLLKGLISKENFTVTAILCSLLLTVLFITHINKPRDRALNLSVTCTGFQIPFALELDLSEAEAFYARGYELQIQHASEFKFTSGKGTGDTVALPVLTFDAQVENNSTQMPFFKLQATSEFGPVTAQPQNVSNITVRKNGVLISTMKGELHVRVDTMAFELAEIGRLKIREFDQREIIGSDVMRFDGNGEAMAVYLQSMASNDPSGQIFQASFPETDTEMRLVQTQNASASTHTTNVGEVEAIGCSKLSYKFEGDEVAKRPKAEQSAIVISYRELKLDNLSLVGGLIALDARANTSSIKIDGHEQIQGRIDSILSRPWYQQGILGFMILFMSMVFVELLKDTVKRVASLAFGKTDR